MGWSRCIRESRMSDGRHGEQRNVGFVQRIKGMWEPAETSCSSCSGKEKEKSKKAVILLLLYPLSVFDIKNEMHSSCF